MANFSKRTIAEYFKFDCERFLRYQLASKSEIDSRIIPNRPIGKMRPGLQLMINAANKWEADKYQDLIHFNDNIAYILEEKVDDRIEQKGFKKVTNIFQLLTQPVPPFAIIEASFKVPPSLSTVFDDLKKIYNIDIGEVNPDIILIRPYSTGAPLINFDENNKPEYELHIVDVKLASEASLKHFTEVTYYAFALAEAIKIAGLDNRYKVSAKGLIWPGCHDENMFRNLVRFKVSLGEPYPLMGALEEILQSVPYEVYEIHVRNFIDNKLLSVMEQNILHLDWHITGKCQLCQYLEDCKEDALKEDHLCKVPFLNSGQAKLLREKNIQTTEVLLNSIDNNSSNWQEVVAENYQLHSAKLALKARTEALITNRPVIIGRNCHFMPAWSDMNIFITIHFDPGTGLTFAMGLKKVYFYLDRPSGASPQMEEYTFIVDTANGSSAQNEKKRLIEFLDVLSRWLIQVDQDNQEITNRRQNANQRDSDFGKKTLHAFFWSKLEVKQFTRMLERHITDPLIASKAETIINMFPPDGFMPDPDIYKSQPGSIVKDVIKHLVGLPIAFEYTIFDTVNNLFPPLKEDGTPYIYKPKFGFYTELNDQIPFERAYELWKDNYFLNKTSHSKYTRAELNEELKRTIKMHLNALFNIVLRLREHAKDKLVQKKSSFKLYQTTNLRLSNESKNLIIFQRLNSIKQEIENKHLISLPVEEKEAKFISIRGLTRVDSHIEEIEEIKRTALKYRNATLWAFEFSPNSKDSKIKEGDFLCAISNEDHPLDYDLPWYKEINLNYYDAVHLINNSSYSNIDYLINKKLSELLSVSIVKLGINDNTPYAILNIRNERYINFCQEYGIINLNSSLVIDPLTKDFESADVEKVLRLLNKKS